MSLFEKIKSQEEKISVIGLGYVGLPVAIEFAKKYNVVGYDITKEKLEKYLEGIDVTNEVGDKAVQNTTMKFTDDENELKSCKFQLIFIICKLHSSVLNCFIPYLICHINAF